MKNVLGPLTQMMFFPPAQQCYCDKASVLYDYEEVGYCRWKAITSHVSLAHEHV